MRTITPRLTPPLERHIGRLRVGEASAYPIMRYRDLVEVTAHLAYLNKDNVLFFRGQNADYRNRANKSTFYPSIYRGDALSASEIKARFYALQVAGEQLAKLFVHQRLSGRREVVRRPYIRWSILQHYGVCGTPLLDFTHSLRVACSFACLDANADHAYVMVFGLPQLTNRISINSEHYLINIRLLGICPPNAIRPHFQEGYLAGTEDLTDEYTSKTEIDFNRRLIAKFQIPTDNSFWGSGFSPLPRSVLYPENDSVEALCSEIRVDLPSGLKPGEMGSFLKAWVQLEGILLSEAEKHSASTYSVMRAIDVLRRVGVLGTQATTGLHEARELRNLVVHRPDMADPLRVNSYTPRIISFSRRLKQAAIGAS